MSSAWLDGAGWAAGRRWVRLRLLVAASLFCGLFVLLAQRAYVLQVKERDRMLRLAEGQYLKDIELPARRGRILDRNGAELAASVEVDSVYANPRQVAASTAGVDGVAKALARPLGVEARELAGKLQSKRYFAWLKRHILPEQARGVRELGLPGVYLVREPRRYYPNRERAGPLLGWASVDGGGLEGIELQQDRELRGTPAEVQGLRDALGREVLPAGAESAMGRPGRDVVTTIDKFIQYRLEGALEAGVAKNHARAATAVALDPKSGEVLAMASWPGLNPNDPTAAGAHSRAGGGARNRAVTDPFEPGSTMKTFSIAAAVEAGLVGPDDPWFCENGRMQVGSATIHDAEPIGNVTTTGVLAESSNICTAKIARRSGKERVEAMLRRFGFGVATGVDLPGERGGLLRQSRRWGEIELATISFGQGVTATPIQIASAYAAVANGGTWYRPHVTRRILDDGGRVLQEVKPEGRRVISPEVAATMRRMLHAVTQKGGTGEKLAIPGYPAGGKTGTAQKVDPLTRRYSTDKWASSFVGFAPLDDPRLLVFVMVDEPSGTHYGGAVAGPVWREVMIEALRYLNVPADASAPAPAPQVADGRAAMQQSGGPARAPAAGAIETQVAVAPLDPVERAFASALEDDGGGPRVPDFTGLSMGEALEVARRLRLPIEVSGSGLAVSQEPPAGAAQSDARCRVTFAPPG